MNASQGARGEGITGKLVRIQAKFGQTFQLAQFSRNGTWGIQNPVKTYKNQVTLSYWYDLTEERLNIEGKSVKKREESTGKLVAL